MLEINKYKIIRDKVAREFELIAKNRADNKYNPIKVENFTTKIELLLQKIYEEAEEVKKAQSESNGKITGELVSEIGDLMHVIRVLNFHLGGLVQIAENQKIERCGSLKDDALLIEVSDEYNDPAKRPIKPTVY